MKMTDRIVVRSPTKAQNYGVLLLPNVIQCMISINAQTTNLCIFIYLSLLVFIGFPIN